MTARNQLPGKVADLLGAPANVAIHGSPGSGKSWMTDRVIPLLEGNIVRVDLSTVGSGASAFQQICRQCLGSPEDPSSTRPESVQTAWRELREAIAASPSHVFLVLDQFDRVLHFNDAEEFLLLLRELVHRPESLPCTALIASRRSLQAIEAKVRGISTLASVCYTEYLGAMNFRDLDALGPGTQGLKEQEEQECLQWSGGHASLAKYWLATRPDRHPDAAAELERAKVVTRVLDHLGELGLIDATAQLVLGPIVQDMFFERQELELLGVLTADGRHEDKSHALSDSATFRDALRSRTWNMDPWGLLGHAEVRMRAVIELCLFDAYGDDWPAVIGRKSRAVAKAHEEAHQKMERDKRMFSREAPWLSYTYPSDLWAIIQLEWELFRHVFNSRDKAHWRRVMTGLAEYRAPLAHGRPEVLGESQRTQCRLFAEEIIAAVGLYESSRLGRPRPAQP